MSSARAASPTRFLTNARKSRWFATRVSTICGVGSDSSWSGSLIAVEALYRACNESAGTASCGRGRYESPTCRTLRMPRTSPSCASARTTCGAGRGGAGNAGGDAVDLSDASRDPARWARELPDLRDGARAQDGDRRGNGRPGARVDDEAVLDRRRAQRAARRVGHGRYARELAITRTAHACPRRV